MNVHRFKNGNQARRCISCKAHVSEQDRICPVCGESLNTTSQPARPAAKPASGPLPPPQQEHNLVRNTEVALFTPTSVPAQPASQQSANVAVVTAMAQPEPPAKLVAVTRPRAASAAPHTTNGVAKANGTAKTLPAAKPPPAQVQIPKSQVPSINIVVVFGAVALLMVGALLLRLGASARSGEGALAASEAQAMNVTVVFAQAALTATQVAQTMPLSALIEPTAPIATPIAVRVISPTSDLVVASAEITNVMALAPTTAVATATDSPTATPAATATPLPTQTPEPTDTPKPTATDVPATATAAPTSAPRLVVVNSPQPTATDVPPTTTAVPTWTPRPTSTATAVPTPEPTATPQPTATDVPPTAMPQPTWTPRPTSTATATPTPEPTYTPQPTATDVPPTATLPPTETPRPTFTATVAPTPEPTATPLPTNTQVPTLTPLPVAQDGVLRYAVKQGDTCLDIANRFGVPLVRLIAYNQFDAKTCFLNIGQIVLIPTTDSSVVERATAMALPTTVPTQMPTAPATAPQAVYTVQGGDTCGSIARRFDISVAQLAAANGLNPTVCFLRAGQQLVISSTSNAAPAVPDAVALPSPTPGLKLYVVKPGDTCLEIATRYKLTVNRLAAANNLNPRTCFLSVGRKLVIP